MSIRTSMRRLAIAMMKQIARRMPRERRPCAPDTKAARQLSTYVRRGMPS